jgi:hypothetical protein
MVELKKHNEPSELIEQGMQINPIEQFSTHDALSHVNLNSTSNNIISMSQFMKHDLPIMSTDRGIQIVCNMQFVKHDSSIIVRFNPPSNLTTPSLFRLLKQPEKQD